MAKAKDNRQKVFSEKTAAEQEAIHMNANRKVGEDGNAKGNYKVYECNCGDKKTFVVAKSPLVAMGYAGTEFGVSIVTDRKAVVKKVDPKTYLSYLDDDERQEWENELARRKESA